MVRSRICMCTPVNVLFICHFTNIQPILTPSFTMNIPNNQGCPSLKRGAENMRLNEKGFLPFLDILSQSK